jgi:molybdenum cofactor cytidylyltransferase
MSEGPVSETVAGTRVAGLILAAGESSRMGRDKALLPFRGRTFLETIIAKVREAGIERVAVVLGHHAEIIQRAIVSSAESRDVEFVINPDYRRGQTSSLQSGVAALQKPATAAIAARSGTPDAVVLCLVDHPAFDPATVQALISRFEKNTGAHVVVPTHEGCRGHPVLIAQPLFAPLLALGADEGANHVIRTCQERTEQVEVSDAGILVDVDDETAYRDLVQDQGPF